MAVLAGILTVIVTPIIAIKDLLDVSEAIRTLSAGLEYVFWVFDKVNFLIPIDTIFMIIGVMIAIALLNICKNFILFVVNAILDVIP